MKLKFSEAILLGDSLKQPCASIFLSACGKYGCAIGGALLADGLTAQEIQMDSGRISMAQQHWPWITDNQLGTVSRMYFLVRRGECTIEQIADYVRTIEPQEEKETVNGSGEHQEVLADSVQR